MRTGRTVRQLGGFRAFVPAPLLPDPPPRLDDALLGLLSEAGQELGRLDGIASLLPDRREFLREFALRDGDPGEVDGYLDAVTLGVERLAVGPFSRQFLLDLHARLMKGAARSSDPAPGSFRKTQNWIGFSNRWDPTEAYYVPPPVAEMHGAIDDLISFLNEESPYPPLLRAGLVFSQLQAIHPFLDGNGRMGRLLVALVLHARGALRYPLFSMGGHFRRHRMAFILKLRATRTAGDLESWLAYFLAAVRDVSRAQAEAAYLSVTEGFGKGHVRTSGDNPLDSGFRAIEDGSSSGRPSAAPKSIPTPTHLESRSMSVEGPSIPAEARGGVATLEAGVGPSGCGCGGGPAAGDRGVVFALGVVGYDLITEARSESIRAHMGGDPADPGAFLAYLARHPWEAASVTWTLRLDEMDIYAIRPSGPFAAEAYARLREFLAEQLAGTVERVSIPGTLAGRASLLNGQVVDEVVPELRGMYSWSTKALVDEVVGPPQGSRPDGLVVEESGVRNFLDRVYYELRNLGVTAEERAINYAATNASKAAGVFQQAAAEGMELDSITVERSPICRPGSECWDVKMMFFHPDRPVLSVRKSFRFTVDVSDVVPVLIGPIRSWSVR